jgi:hypothetical protein
VVKVSTEEDAILDGVFRGGCGLRYWTGGTQAGGGIGFPSVALDSNTSQPLLTAPGRGVGTQKLRVSRRHLVTFF